jgi:hypothetical protein
VKMEKEPFRHKLMDVVSVDFPDATEILVSFPDEWELVEQIRHVKTTLYVGSLPSKKERTKPDQFYGLPPEINMKLNTYQIYRLFEPWPMPSAIVSWNDTIARGKVKGLGGLKIQLNPLGQAQAWLGRKVAVLWECYLNESAKVRHGQNLIYPFWNAVEHHMKAREIFTQPHEPTWEHGYTDFLSKLGYGPDPTYSQWWSKQKPS